MSSRSVIQTDAAPAAIGPYSQAIAAGDLLFCAGQIPLDPASGEIVTGGVRDQAERVISNLTAVLEAGGSSIEQVVKLDVFMADLAQFAVVNEYLAAVFTEAPPARATVEVSALPLGAAIEMAAIAVRK
jgi:2-iminobutanoate/2-iminopropanoate deaminase